MKYRKLGRTGFEVSDIAYGLWGMSGWSGSDDQQSLDSLQLSVDSGCNFFDTAWAYGEGKSDGLLGETMARNPTKRLYAASKIPPANGQWPALPKYKYHDVFSADHVVKYADHDPQETPRRLHRPFAVSCLGRQLDRRSGIPLDGGKTERRRLDSPFRPQPEPLGAGERHQSLCTPD